MVRKTPMYGTPPGSLKEDLAEHHKPAAFSRIQVAALVRIGVAAFSRIARPLSTEFCTHWTETARLQIRWRPAAFWSDVIPLTCCWQSFAKRRRRQRTRVEGGLGSFVVSTDFGIFLIYGGRQRSAPFTSANGTFIPPSMSNRATTTLSKCSRSAMQGSTNARNRCYLSSARGCAKNNGLFVRSSAPLIVCQESFFPFTSRNS